MSEEKKEEGKKKGSRLMSVVWVILAFVSFIVPAFALLLIVGLLPTIVAWITDEYREKYAAYTVGAFNLCGIIPYFFELWSKGHTVRDAALILQDMQVWLVMYGAAALGWLFYYGAPMFASIYIAMRDDHLIEKIKREQERLVKEWGEGVKGDPPKDKTSSKK